MRQFLCLTALLCLVVAPSTEVFAQKKAISKAASKASKQAPAEAVAPQAAPTLTPEQVISNLRAFAKLYGYVRYFHPSDEASRLDWNGFLMYAIPKVKLAKTTEELKATLQTLFFPIAPTMRLFSGNEKPTLDAVPGNPAQHKVVAWQHKSIGLGSSMARYRMYESIRTNADNPVPTSGPNFGSITTFINNESTTSGIRLKDVLGKQIKLSAALRAEVQGGDNQGQLWMRVDKPKFQTAFFDNMADRPVTSRDWREYTIVGSVDTSAVGVTFGCFLSGKGKVWVDDMRLFARNNATEEWQSLPLSNASFEKHYTMKSGIERIEDWGYSQNYSFTPVTENVYHGKKAVLIQDKQTDKFFRGELFSQKPTAGEIIVKELASGLQCALPIALFTDSTTIFGTTSQSKVEFDWLHKLAQEYDAPKFLSIDNESVRLAHVIIAWNILQHSYPYFDVVKVNWNEVLTTSLQQVMYAYTKEELTRIMRQMLEKLQDGHAGYYDTFSQRFYTPAQVDLLEGKSVVVCSQDSALKRGDIILKADGKDALQRVKEEELLISGSPQWKRAQAASALLQGTTKEVEYAVLRGNAEVVIKTLREGYKKVYEYPAIKQVKGSTANDAVWYVDISQIETKEFTAKIQELVQAKGVIFDMRGYPNNNFEILSHLIDTTIKTARWNVPRILYPDQNRFVGYDTSGRWDLQPKAPRLKGKIIFLTGNGAISAAETMMGMVEYYKLGEIVGDITAATNGNINSFMLPGNYSFVYTGMKVLKHDGSQHHLVGIKPTVPAVRTIKGIQEGRDEVLEKALSLLP
jgi:C-terminal processing protease CtpA/Prc